MVWVAFIKMVSLIVVVSVCGEYLYVYLGLKIAINEAVLLCDTL